jgi:hypothetical protein
VGDLQDLPAHTEGLWAEITTAELAYDAQAHRRARKMTEACSACLECAHYGFGCQEPVSQKIVNLLADDPAYSGPFPIRPDCWERDQ